MTTIIPGVGKDKIRPRTKKDADEIAKMWKRAMDSRNIIWRN